MTALKEAGVEAASLVERLKPKHTADEPIARAVVSTDQAERLISVETFLLANNALKSEARARIEQLERQLAGVEAERDKLRADAIVAPAECDEECDDPDCPYQHKPLTLLQAYENAVSRMRDSEDAARRHHRAMADAQERLQAAERQLATARTALEPFAEAADAIDQVQWPRPDWQVDGGEFKAGQLRAARAAIRSLQSDGGKP